MSNAFDRKNNTGWDRISKMLYKSMTVYYLNNDE